MRPSGPMPLPPDSTAITATATALSMPILAESGSSMPPYLFQMRAAFNADWPAPPGAFNWRAGVKDMACNSASVNGDPSARRGRRAMAAWADR